MTTLKQLEIYKRAKSVTNLLLSSKEKLKSNVLFDQYQTILLLKILCKYVILKCNCSIWIMSIYLFAFYKLIKPDSDLTGVEMYVDD